MDDSGSRPSPSPDRSEAIPKSYAVYAGRQRINVWQYRVDVSNPDGEWRFVETLDRDDDPKLSMDQATLLPPGRDGYWIYTKSYDCELDCE